jgi:putative tryptophan/tyrosine transport system substrate-binding protein
MRRRDFICGLGSASAWPLAARAQRRLRPAIGYLGGVRENSFPQWEVAFRQGLGEQGYTDGQNVEILYRWAEFQYDRLPALAADLLRQGVAVMAVTVVTSAVLAAKAATATDPNRICDGDRPGRAWPSSSWFKEPA